MSNSTSAATIVGEQVQIHPFLEFNGLTNGSWFVFFIIAVASSKLARSFPAVGLPLITGYLCIGCLCGPYILNMVTSTQIPDLTYITQFALAFIAFSAGSELYLPELRSLFKLIVLITVFNAFYTYFIMTFLIYLLAYGGVIGWMGQYIGGCAFTISMVAASIMVARSPASAIAVVRELRAKGPMTSTMLGVTVVGDVVVLVLFTISCSFALAVCEGGGFEGGAFVITMITLVSAFGIGYALGGLLIFLLWVKHIRHLILPIGWFVFVLCDWFAVWSIDNVGVSLNFDALLICITAGYVVTNQSRNRAAFLQLLGSASSYIFIPFFTKVGVELNIPVFLQSIGFAFIVFAGRALCIFLGSFSGARVAGTLDKQKEMTLWLTMLAQAGVSLGLASEVRVKFPDWGPNCQTSVIAVVLINQLVGPVACKWALRKNGEAGKMLDGEDGEHGHSEGPKKVKRALIIGIDTTTLSVAQRFLNKGWAVTLMDTNRENLDLKKKLVLVEKEITSKATKIADDHEQPKDGEEAKKDDVKEELEKPNETEKEKDLEKGGAEMSESRKDDDDGEGEKGALNPTAMPSDSPSDSEPPTDPSSSSSLSESRLLVHQIPISNDPSRTLGEVVDSLLPDTSLSSIEAAVVQMNNDEETYDVCAFLIERRHYHNVIARIYNPSWAPVFSEHGIIPYFTLSVTSHMLYKGMVSKSPVFCPDVLSLPDAFKSFIPDPPEEDFAFAIMDVSHDYRDEYANRHSAPTVQVKQRLKDLTDIRLRTVAQSQRNVYMDKLFRTQNVDFKDVLSKDEERHEQTMMLGPIGQRTAEAEVKQREIDKEKAETPIE